MGIAQTARIEVAARLKWSLELLQVWKCMGTWKARMLVNAVLLLVQKYKVAGGVLFFLSLTSRRETQTI